MSNEQTIIEQPDTNEIAERMEAEIHRCAQAELRFVIDDEYNTISLLEFIQRELDQLVQQVWGANDHGRNDILAQLIAIHRCSPISRTRYAGTGRSWWVGLLKEPLPHPFESETHCVHERTPGRSTVHFVNSSDVGIYAVLAYILNGNRTVNPQWVESIAKSDAQAAALKERGK